MDYDHLTRRPASRALRSATGFASSRRFTGALTRLTEPENALFEALRDDRLGERLRLEQERVEFGWLQRALAGPE